MIDIVSKNFAPQSESKIKWVITMYQQKRVLDCLILSFLLKSEGLSTNYSERNCDHDTNVPA